MLSYLRKAPVTTPVSPGIEPRTATFSESFAVFGTRLSRILSTPSAVSSVKSGAHSGAKSPVESTNEQDRSRSRGRQETFHSSGRGGAGNIRPASQSRGGDTNTEISHVSGPDDFSSTRGREMNVSPKVTHSGRGGAGNIRSPSREPGSGLGATTHTDQREIDVLRMAAERDAELPHSSGRGGAGNIFASRSRSRSQARGETETGGAFRSSGRGGAGNIMADGHGIDENIEDEVERKAHHHVDTGIHSTGRGGSANLTASTPPPVVESAAPGHGAHTVTSSGRGGAGNIREASKTREASRTRTANADNI